ncbi:hypothetical protein ES703_110251 [subsurface metagenome]
MLAPEVPDEQVIVRLSNCLNQPLAVFLDLVAQSLWDLDLIGISPQLVVIDQPHPIDQIHDADKGRFLAHRHLYGHRRSLQARSYHGYAAPEVSSWSIHLVDETDAWNTKAIRLAPDRFRLGLYSADRIKNNHATVQHTQTALDLSSKVYMTRSIDDVNAMISPEAGNRSRCYGNAPLPLLLHPVGDGSSIIHTAQPIGLAGVEQEPFGRRCFSRIDVSDYSYVASPIQWTVSDKRIHSFLCPFSTGYLCSKKYTSYRTSRPACHDRTRAVLPIAPSLRGQAVSPPVMCKCLVGFGHTVCILTPLDGNSRVPRRIHELISHLLREGLSRAIPRRRQQPAHRQRHSAVSTDLHRHLIGGATHAPGFHFEQGGSVSHGLFENGQSICVGALSDDIHRFVDQPSGRALFAAFHHLVDEGSQQLAIVPQVWLDNSPRWPIASRHYRLLHNPVEGPLQPTIAPSTANTQIRSTAE